MRRGVWLAGIVAWSAIPGCGLLGFGCNIEDEARAIAGEDASLCGDQTCATWAFENGEPFYLFFLIGGRDSRVVNWLVSDGDRVWVLSQDVDGFGVGRVDGWECTAPDMVDGEIVCGGRVPADNHYQVCRPTGGGEPEALPFPG